MSSDPTPAATAGFVPVEHCRSCGQPGLRTFLSLGTTPVANALLRPEDLERQEPAFPLEVAHCPTCALVQLAGDVPAGALFPSDYPYFSSFSDQLVDHGRRHCERLIETRGLTEHSLVVEVGSNDGYLLRHFAERGIPVLGIDPSPGQAEAAERIGVPTLVEFFGAEVAERLRSEGRRADVIVANNVMAHTPDLNGFVDGIATLLADDGVATIENPYVRELIEHREFDTIYHEHVCYFSCTSVAALMRGHGLSLNAVEPLSLHGGSLRWYVGRTPAVEDSAREYLEAEAEAGLDRYDFYERFARDVDETRDELVALLRRLRGEGATLAAYGAAAKGSTLLNFAGIGPDLVEYVVDRNVHKQGMSMPGVHLPIHSPDRLLEDRPDFLLLLAWNFADEIIAQQADYAKAGGRFIVPVPTPRIVEG